MRAAPKSVSENLEYRVCKKSVDRISINFPSFCRNCGFFQWSPYQYNISDSAPLCSECGDYSKEITIVPCSIKKKVWLLYLCQCKVKLNIRCTACRPTSWKYWTSEVKLDMIVEWVKFTYTCTHPLSISMFLWNHLHWWWWLWVPQQNLLKNDPMWINAY